MVLVARAGGRTPAMSAHLAGPEQGAPFVPAPRIPNPPPVATVVHCRRVCARGAQARTHAGVQATHGTRW